jgi:hypothetical protein
VFQTPFCCIFLLAASPSLQNSELTILLDEDHTDKNYISYPNSPTAWALTIFKYHLLPPWRKEAIARVSAGHLPRVSGVHWVGLGGG